MVLNCTMFMLKMIKSKSGPFLIHKLTMLNTIENTYHQLE